MFETQEVVQGVSTVDHLSLTIGRIECRFERESVICMFALSSFELIELCKWRFLELEGLVGRAELYDRI